MPTCPFCGKPMTEGAATCIVLLGDERLAAHCWTCSTPACGDGGRQVTATYPDRKPYETATGIPLRVAS